MKLLYCRVSTLDQNTDRQKVKEKDYDYVIEDKVSGAIPFFERPGGQDILKLLKKSAVSSIAVYTIDRLGRNLLDILRTIEFFTKKNIPIYFLSQTLCTLDKEGKINPMTTMMIAMLGAVGEMERTQIRERQLEGIKLAKARGIYKGRAAGTKENIGEFLAKPANKKALKYLHDGLKPGEVAKLTKLHPNTITKIKKLGMYSTPKHLAIK